MKNIRLSRTFAVIGLALIAIPNFAGQAGTYTLRLRMRPGTKTNYAMAMNMNMDMSKMPQQNTAQKMPKNLAVNIKMNYSMSLQKVSAGQMTWKMSINSASMTSNAPGKMPDMSKEMKGKTATITTSDRGKILKVEGDAKLGMQGLGGAQGFTGVVFPEKAVGIGSRWSETVTQQNVSITMNYKVLGVKQLGVAPGLVISGTISGSQMMSTPSPIMFVVNASTGEMISSNGKINMATMGISTTVNFSVAKK